MIFVTGDIHGITGIHRLNSKNFKKLNKYNTEEWNGGKVHKIKDNIIHLTRGQIFNIDGNTFFTMGGGISHKKRIIKKKSKINPEEIFIKDTVEAHRNLEAVNYKVDYILTHTCSNEINKELNYFKTDYVSNFLSEIQEKVQYKHWYFGHFHKDKSIDDKHTCVHKNIIKLNDNILN